MAVLLCLLLLSVLIVVGGGGAFGRKQGVPVNLNPATHDGKHAMHPKCRNTNDFHTATAKACCDMYLSHPSMTIGMSWGNLPEAMQQLWDDIQCDKLSFWLRRARAV